MARVAPPPLHAAGHTATSVMDPAAGSPSLPRHVVSLSDALAALLGQAEGAEITGGAELPEDEFLDGLRAAGLVTYLSPPAQPHALAVHAATSAAQPPAAAAAAAERGPNRRDVRLAGALAALLGHAEGAEITEDEVLGRLREARLITYPSPLLRRLLEELLDLFVAEVLPQLDPTARALFSRVGGACRAAVVSSGLPHAGTIGGEPFEVRHFVATVPLLAWAKAKGCPWNAKTCQSVAGCWRGTVDVMQWAREHHCPWDAETCAFAAFTGNLEVLQWVREHGCPWDTDTCSKAAFMGHLEVLQWARAQDPPCPWNVSTCAGAAGVFSRFEVLQWARENGCPWDGKTCASAALSGRLDVLQWARERDCPWDWWTLWGAHQGGHPEILAWAQEHGCPMPEPGEFEAEDALDDEAEEELEEEMSEEEE